MKLNSRDCSCFSASGFRCSSSTDICARLATSFTYLCRRMSGGGYCRQLKSIRGSDELTIGTKVRMKRHHYDLLYKLCTSVALVLVLVVVMGIWHLGANSMIAC